MNCALLLAKYKEWHGRQETTFIIDDDKTVSLSDVHDDNKYNDDTQINKIITATV